MLKENIRILRKAKGLSQAELAARLHVVRQTVSKWEQGLSVPDADLLTQLSEVLEAPVATLLGETAAEPPADDLKAISAKLEVLNLQLYELREARRKRRHVGCGILCAAIIAVMVLLFFLGSPYLGWDYGDPETAVAGTLLHGFEFVFVRLAPLAFFASLAGLLLTRRRD